MKIALTYVGRPISGTSAKGNVRQLKTALACLGYYIPMEGTGIDDAPDAQLDDAIYAFQRRRTVAFDDTMTGPGSTTERLINEEMARQVREGGSYIWRTAGDADVRDGHIARSARRFSWNAPPEGGHPGKDYNCRCWAESLVQEHHPWKDWVKEQQENRALLESPYLQQVGAGAVFFDGAIISTALCMRNGRCRAWLMKKATEHVLESTYHLPPKTLPAFPDAKRASGTRSRKRWVDSEGKIYEWDSQHGEVEIYDKTGKSHLGGYDPKTGKQTSKPVKGRKTEK